MSGCIPFHTCIQTRSTCSIESYALIEFNNYTEIRKFTYIQRFYDGEPLGEPIIQVVEPKTSYRYRVPSGYYELGHKKTDGTYQAWQTRESTKGKPWVPLAVCSNTSIIMAEKEVPVMEFKIRPRNQ